MSGGQCISVSVGHQAALSTEKWFVRRKLSVAHSTLAHTRYSDLLFSYLKRNVQDDYNDDDDHDYDDDDGDGVDDYTDNDDEEDDDDNDDV